MSAVKRSKSGILSGKDVVDGKKKTYESVLNHVILPRTLPKELPENAANEENVLISRMTEAVVSCAGWIPERIVRNFQRFKRTHSDLTAKTVSRQIDALEPGDTFAVLVKQQKCVFLVHMPLSEEDAYGTKMVQIGTFPSAASSKEIYKCSGDLQLTCPTFITEVEFSGLLRSEAFSQQLCRLYETTGYTKKNQTPVYVNAWLTAILCRKKNNRETEFKMPHVTKKMRDEVVGKGEKAQAGVLAEPWQRSPFYITMKALLQISLAIENDTIESKFVHKIVMLRFITRFCVEFENPAIFPAVNTELISQLLAKMARRIEKLSRLKAQYGDNDNHDDFYKQIVDEAKQSIAKIRARIDRQMVQLHEWLERKAQLKPLRDLNFEHDVKQRIPKIQEYLNKRKTFCENENDYAEPVQPRELRRHTMNQRLFPQFEHFEAMDELEKQMYLNDSENWYLYTLRLEHDMPCTQLQKKYNDYMKCAEKIHSGDPREQSIMMLIRLKFLAMMDRMVTRDFPLLLEHRTGIDTSIFDVLLLPQAKDMQIAQELQLYFERRNEAYYPSLVEESEITSESFAVRYVGFNLDIQDVRQRILDDAEKQIQAKKLEWVMFRQKAQQLRDKASTLRCIQPGNVEPSEMFYHRLGCDKCLTECQLKEMKIKQYQHPLPECIDRQNAIVFELRIPNEIAILRDLLHSINKSGHDARNKLDIKENWFQKELLASHKTARPTNVVLGSTITNQPAEFSVEDRIDFSNLVVMNLSNCVLHETNQELCATIKVDGIQRLFTLSVEAGSPYARLQWALISTNHTQNQVLARQAECPQNLLLSEFKEFCSLRADGHRLQLRKLCAMIETDAMSFDQPSVLSLILQTIWQMGPRSENDFVRESHEDFVNADFAMVVIELLEKCIKQQEDNWANPTKLLTIVFIGLRIFELNDFEDDDAHVNILDHVMKILHKIRAISLNARP